MRKITCFFLLLFMMAIGMSAQTTPPESAPTPDVKTENVKSVYSDAYTQETPEVSGFNFTVTPASCTETTAKIVEETLESGKNKVLKISNFGLVNIKLASEFDAKSYLMFHIDIYAEQATKLAVGAIMWAPGDMANQTKVVDIKGGEWTQIDIPISYFVGDKTNLGNFYALRIYDVDKDGNATETNNNDKTFWIDNVYVYNYEQKLNTIEVSANKLAVEEGRTEQIKVNVLDQKGAPFDAEKNEITYSYSIKGEQNNSSVSDTGLYTAGTARTTTTVIVSAVKSDETLKTTEITFTNIVRPFRPGKAEDPKIADKDGDNGNAASVYSDYFEKNKGFNFGVTPNGLDQVPTDATIEADTDDTLEDNILKVSNFKRINVQLANEIGALEPAKYLMFHIDIYSPTATKLAIAPITYGPGEMTHQYKVVDIKGGEWTQIDLPVEYFQEEKPHNFYAVRIYDVDENGNAVETGNGNKTFWIDNVYVYNYAQVLDHLNPAFPNTTKSVRTGTTSKIVPTAIDTEGLTITEANRGEKVTYTYAFNGEANYSTVDRNTGEYKAGETGTRTVVTVTATQGTKTVSGDVTITNMGDAPIIDEFVVAGRDNNVATLKLHISSLQKSADIAVSYGSENVEITGVPTNVDLLYRVDGLEAGVEYAFTLNATTQADGNTYNDSKTLTVTTLADYNPGQATTPTVDANNVINLFCSTSIYPKSPMWGRAARADEDPARNIKKGDRYFRMYTSTPMEIKKLQYTTEEDLAAAVKGGPVSDKVLPLSYTPTFTDVQFGEDVVNAPNRSFAKNFALVVPQGEEVGDYCLRITQFDRSSIFFGGGEGNIHKGFDCTGNAPVKLKSLELDMLATEAMTVEIKMHNLNESGDKVVATVDLSEKEWQHISISNDVFKSCMSNSGLTLTRTDGNKKEDITAMLFVDNLYYKTDDVTTLRKVNEADAEKLGYATPDDGWEWNESGEYLVDKTDQNIKMAVIYGVWDMFDWEQDNADTEVGAVLNKEYTWFDCRNVSGLDYQGRYPGHVFKDGVSGNSNAFVLTEAIQNEYTTNNRGLTQPAFSTNNVYQGADGKYYAHHVMQYVRNSDYAPTNRKIEHVTANGLYMLQAYNNDVYNTVIVPCDATITSTVRYKAKQEGSEEDSDVWKTKEAIQGVYHMTSVENRTEGVDPLIAVYFTSVPKETKTVDGNEISYFSIEANEPYLVVADKVGSEDVAGNITGYEASYTIDSKDEHTSLIFTPEEVQEIAEGKSIKFTGSYVEKTNPAYGEIYVFAASKGDERNTLHVGRLGQNSKLHQYRCYFEFEGFTSAEIKQLAFYMEENNGETTSIRLATDDEVRGIVGGIFSIDGKRISDNANDANKIGLPKGMYIINGKKVVIK